METENYLHSPERLESGIVTWDDVAKWDSTQWDAAMIRSLEKENYLSLPERLELDNLTQWHTAAFLLMKLVQERYFKNPMPYKMQRRARAAGEFLYQVRHVTLDIYNDYQFFAGINVIHEYHHANLFTDPRSWIKAIILELIRQDLGPADHSLMSGKSADRFKYSPDTAFGLLIILAAERAKMSKYFKAEKLKPLLEAWEDTNEERRKYFSGPKAVLRRSLYQQLDYGEFLINTSSESDIPNPDHKRQ